MIPTSPVMHAGTDAQQPCRQIQIFAGTIDPHEKQASGDVPDACFLMRLKKSFGKLGSVPSTGPKTPGQRYDLLQSTRKKHLAKAKSACSERIRNLPHRPHQRSFPRVKAPYRIFCTQVQIGRSCHHRPSPRFAEPYAGKIHRTAHRNRRG